MDIFEARNRAITAAIEWARTQPGETSAQEVINAATKFEEWLTRPEPPTSD